MFENRCLLTLGLFITETDLLNRTDPIQPRNATDERQVIPRDKCDVFVIHRRSDATWVEKNLRPLFQQLELAACDCHMPRNKADVGQKLTDFIGKYLDSTSCFIIVCSPEKERAGGDFSFQYSVDKALYKSAEHQSRAKLLIIATDGKLSTVPESLRHYTYINWTVQEQKTLLIDTLQSICT